MPVLDAFAMASSEFAIPRTADDGRSRLGARSSLPDAYPGRLLAIARRAEALVGRLKTEY